MINQGFSLSAWCEQLGQHHPLYMAVIDREMRLSFVNSHFCRAFQQIAMPGNDRLFRSLIDVQDLAEFDTVLKTRPGAADDLTIQVRMKHGLAKWVQWHMRPLDGHESGKMMCLGYDLQPASLTGNAAPGLGKENPVAGWKKKLAESIVHAQHEERARIGQELHDNICQILTSAHLYTACLERDSVDFDFIKGKALEIILHAVEEVRNLSREMVLPDFRQKGLICSINDLVNELRYGSHLEIGFQHTDLMTIESQDQQLKLILFRIIQTQLRNILKHSEASRVDISLHASNDQIRLSIQDNGVGFDPATVKHGLGLSGIDEKAALYGGKVILNAGPGKGCALIVTIPMELRRIL